MDIVLVEQPLSPLQGDVVTAQRGTLVARDERPCPQTLALITAHLFDGEPHKRLNAAHVNDAFFQGVLVVEGKFAGHRLSAFTSLYMKQGARDGLGVR